MTNITMTADALNGALADEMGVDLKAQTDEELRTVVWLWTKQHPYSLYSSICRDWEKVNEGHSFEPKEIYDYAWRRRKDKPWQKSIEEFHASWRRDPPPYSADLQTAFTLGPALQERGLSEEFIANLGAMVYEWDRGQNARAIDFALCHATPRQRAEAALAALRGAKEE